MTRLQLAVALAVACNSGSKPPGPGRASDPLTPPPKDAAMTTAHDLLVATVTGRRIVDRDRARAARAWPGILGVLPRAEAARRWTAVSEGATVAAGTARIAIAPDAPQSFAIDLGGDYRVLLQLAGWHMDGDKVVLDAVRFKSNYQLELGVGSSGVPVQPATVSMSIGSAYIARGQSFENPSLAYAEFLEIDPDSITAAPPADAVSSSPSAREAAHDAWAAWPTITRKQVP
jgi:hypothetical protein